MLEAVADRLGELRDTYAGTLDEDAAAAYAASFEREARRRHPKVLL